MQILVMGDPKITLGGIWSKKVVANFGKIQVCIFLPHPPPGYANFGHGRPPFRAKHWHFWHPKWAFLLPTPHICKFCSLETPKWLGHVEQNLGIFDPKMGIFDPPDMQILLIFLSWETPKWLLGAFEAKTFFVKFWHFWPPKWAFKKITKTICKCCKFWSWEKAKFYFTCISSSWYLIMVCNMKKIHLAIMEECAMTDS